MILPHTKFRCILEINWTDQQRVSSEFAEMWILGQEMMALKHYLTKVIGNTTVKYVVSASIMLS